jgi:hypothetical protein
VQQNRLQNIVDVRASSLQFRASKINMALARMDKLVKKLMSNPEKVLMLPVVYEKYNYLLS